MDARRFGTPLPREVPGVHDVDPASVDEAKRAGNQLIFRQTNEQIREVVDAFGQVLPVVPLVCECSDPACRRLLAVPIAVYGSVRETPTRFLHALDHVDDGTRGAVAGVFDGFAVVEKQGAAAEVVAPDDEGGRHGA
jgi:hypothetical protein